MWNEIPSNSPKCFGVKPSKLRTIGQNLIRLGRCSALVMKKTLYEKPSAQQHLKKSVENGIRQPQKGKIRGTQRICQLKNISV